MTRPADIAPTRIIPATSGHGVPACSDRNAASAPNKATNAEGAQSGFRHRMTLALESDQQPDRKRCKKCREPFQVGALKPGDLHFLLSSPPVATTG